MSSKLSFLFKNHLFNNLLIGLLVVGVLAVLVFTVQSLVFKNQDLRDMGDTRSDAASTEADAASDLETKDIPPFTEEVRQQLADSHGFSMLVSYTDQGFEPPEVSLEAGESIRITNNSSAELKLSADQAGCDQSAKTACRDIATRGFWELTFPTSGSFEYQDARSPFHTLLITVR